MQRLCWNAQPQKGVSRLRQEDAPVHWDAHLSREASVSPSMTPARPQHWPGGHGHAESWSPEVSPCSFQNAPDDTTCYPPPFPFFWSWSWPCLLETLSRATGS